MLGAGGVGNSALKEVQGAYDRSRADITADNQRAQGFYGQAESLYQPLAEGGRRAFDRYLDGLGANGAEGSERAQANFRTSPGYGFMQDQALGAVQRSAAARGGLAGGNATADILRTATGLADQSWNSYVSGLGNAAQFYQPGIAGQANALGAQGGIQQSQGAQLGALGTTLGQNAAGLYGSAANLSARQGDAMAGLQTGAAEALVKNNTALAQSQNAASANLIDLGKSLVGGFTNFAAGGGTLSSLANVFK